MAPMLFGRHPLKIPGKGHLHTEKRLHTLAGWSMTTVLGWRQQRPTGQNRLLGAREVLPQPNPQKGQLVFQLSLRGPPRTTLYISKDPRSTQKTASCPLPN